MKPEDYLRDFLQRTGKTQKALAKEIGLAQSTVGTWLIGGKPIPMERALMLAKLYPELDPEKLCPRLRALRELKSDE